MKETVCSIELFQQADKYFYWQNCNNLNDINSTIDISIISIVIYGLYKLMAMSLSIRQNGFSCKLVSAQPNLLV